MNIAAYIRCSTDRQDDSPEVQLALIKEYCTKHGYKIVGIYIDEAVSGGSEIISRPAFKQLLADRQIKNIQGIVVLKIDRLSRELFDFLSFERALKKNKLQIFYVTETYDNTASGNLLKQLNAMFAEMERKQTGERIKQHNRHLAMQGRWPSGLPPLGYSYDPKTKQISIDNIRLQDAIAVFETYIACNGNKSQTAYRLNAMGIKTRSGKLWRGDGVTTIINNPIYQGRIRYQEIETECPEIPRIIPDDLLNRAVTIYKNTTNTRAHATHSTYTYSSMIQCASCGYTYKICERRNGYEMYCCRGNKEFGTCKCGKVSSNWIDAMVTRGLEQAFNQELDLLNSYEAEVNDELAVIYKNRMQKIIALKQSKKRLNDLYVNGHISSIDELNARVRDIDEQIAELDKQESISISKQEIETMLNNLTELWQHSNTTEKRALLLVVCPEIILFNNGERKIILKTTLSIGNVEVYPDSPT